MRYSVNIHPVLPVRRSPEETSEMVTQLLFGESFKITDEDSGWCKIENDSDSYTGWIDAKMTGTLEYYDYKRIVSGKPYLTNSPLTEIKSIDGAGLFYLTRGSLLHEYDKETREFKIGYRRYVCLTGDALLPSENPDALLHTAESFLNVPYLWGGKSIFGIDCSGFIQLIFGLHGVALPRDAKDQYMMGTSIDYSEFAANDLAFFTGKDGNITHVGMLTGNNRIIHASGCVKRDDFDEKGIFSEELRKYTHKLGGIKRLNIKY